MKASIRFTPSLDFSVNVMYFFLSLNICGALFTYVDPICGLVTSHMSCFGIVCLLYHFLTFSFTKLNKHSGVLKNHLEANNYVEKYFCPLTNGEHALLQSSKLTIVPAETMRTVYLNRFPDEIYYSLI